MKNRRSLSAISSILMVLLLAAVVMTGSRAVPSVSAAEEPLYMFNVIGDMQMGDPGCYDEENYKAALEEIKNLSPETKAILTVGENTKHSERLKMKYCLIFRCIMQSGTTTEDMSPERERITQSRVNGWIVLLNMQS